MAMNGSLDAGVPVELDARATEVYAHLFQALADPTRLAVLQHLSYGEHRVRDLVEHVGLAQSTVSKHVAFLLECGLVSVRPDGRSSWYALAEPEATARLINAAEALLGATGTSATLCGHLRRPRAIAGEAEAS
ncbi:DNA-binding transcriptional ArsR family regulator [Microbacterium sp. 1262]